MNTLIFDTETTGVRPKGAGLAPTKAEPHLIQVAAKLVNGIDVIAQYSSFIVPIVPIPKEKFFLDQGYTDEFIRRVGVEELLAIKIFNQLVRRADHFVCHNATFDYPIMRAAYQRHDQDIDTTIPVFCTMLTLEPIMKLPGKFGYKWPRLDEAYRFFTGESFSGAHDAMNDVSATHVVYNKLMEQGHDLVQVN